MTVADMFVHDEDALLWGCAGARFLFQWAAPSASMLLATQGANTCLLGLAKCRQPGPKCRPLEDRDTF